MNPQAEPEAEAGSTYFLDSSVQKSKPKPKARAQAKSQSPVRDPRAYPTQNQDAKPQTGTPSILQSRKSGLKGHV